MKGLCLRLGTRRCERGMAAGCHPPPPTAQSFPSEEGWVLRRAAGPCASAAACSSLLLFLHFGLFLGGTRRLPPACISVRPPPPRLHPTIAVVCIGPRGRRVSNGGPRGAITEGFGTPPAPCAGRRLGTITPTRNGGVAAAASVSGSDRVERWRQTLCLGAPNRGVLATIGIRCGGSSRPRFALATGTGAADDDFL